MAKLVIDVEVDDKGNVKLQGIKGHVNDLDGTLKNLSSTATILRNAFMALVAALGIRELGQAIQSWMKLSMAQEKADNALKMAIMSNRSYSLEFIKSTMDQAVALQRLTGIDRINIEEGQKMLMTYHKLSIDEIPRATKVMVDLAARSGDIYLAAKAIGGLSDGTTRFLRNMGVMLDANVLKTKGMTGALDVLEQMLKSQGAVLGQGYNAWNIFKTQLDEARKRAGDFFNEVAVGSGVLDVFLGWIDKLIGKIDELKKSGALKDWAQETAYSIIDVMKELFPIFAKLSGMILQVGIGWGYITGVGLKAQAALFATRLPETRPMIEAELKRKQDPWNVAENLQYGYLDIREQKAARIEEIAALKETLKQYDELDQKRKTLMEMGQYDIDISNKMQGWLDKANEEFPNWLKKISSFQQNIKETYFQKKQAEGMVLMQDLGFGFPVSQFLTGNVPKQFVPIPPGPSEEELKAAEAAIKKAADEAAKSLAEFNKLADSLTLSPYENELKKLTADFEEYKPVVKDAAKLNEIWELALTSLGKKFPGVSENYQSMMEDFKSSLPIIKNSSDVVTDFLGNQTEIVNELSFNMKKYGQDALAWFDNLNKGMAKQIEADKIAKENRQTWIDIGKSAGEGFTDAFADTLMGDKNAFENMGKSIARNILSGLISQNITQPFIGPLLSSIIPGMQGNLVPAGVTGPLAPGQAYAPAWMGNYGNEIAGSLGAGAVGYGIGGMGGMLGGMGGYAGGAALAAGGGTLAGMTVAGPVGLAVAGIILGSALTGAFKSEDVKIPNAKIVYEVVDGELKKISEHWKDTARDSGLVDSVTSFFDAQILFYDRLSTITGQKMADMKLSVSGRGIGEIASEMEVGMSAAVLRLALANYGELSSAFGERFTSEFEKLYGTTFNRNPTELLYGTTFNRNPVWGKGETKNPSLEEVAGNPEEIKKLFDMYSHSFMRQPSMMEQMMGGTTGQAWKDLLQPFIDQLTEIWSTLSSDLGSAFLGSLSTGEFKDFEQQFKGSIFKGVSESIAQAFMSRAMDLVIGPESGIFASLSGAKNLLADYISGKEGVTIQDVMGGFSTSFGDITNVMGELKPVWDEFNTGMQNLAQVLGLNTAANEISNTSLQTYSASVDSFLAELSGGSLAPSQSTAGMMGQYNTLYGQALLDPTKFSALSGFVGGSYLPGLQGISPDYTGSYAGVVSQLGGLKTAWGMPSLDTASPVNPADYAMPTTAGQTQGPGFKQMMKEAFQEVVQEKLVAMLKDIADAAREDSTVTGDITIKGSIGTLMIKEIKSDADVRTVVHNA